jgi:hypothetical protein
MPFPPIYLHIGRPKTGTTSLQIFFYKNRRALMDRGILYPSTGLWGSAHHSLAVSLLENCPGDIRNIPKISRSLAIKDLLSEIENKHPQKVIISSEFFSLYTINNSDMERLRDFFLKFSVTIIVYLRDQTKYLISSFSQQVRNAALTKSLSFDEHKNEFLSRKSNDYLSWVDIWANFFERENVIVRPFEREQLAAGEVVADFLSLVAPETTNGLIEPDQKANPSLSPHRIKLMNLLAGLSLPANIRLPLSTFLQTAPSFSAEGCASPAYLDRTEIKAIRSRFIKTNAGVARKYLHREGDSLFYNDEILIKEKENKYECPPREFYRGFAQKLWAYDPLLAKRLSEFISHKIDKSPELLILESALPRNHNFFIMLYSILKKRIYRFAKSNHPTL